MGANQIELLIKARDEASASLRQLAKEIERLNGTTGQFAGMFDKATKGTEDFTTSVAKMAAGFFSAEMAMRVFNATLNATVGQLQRGIESISQMQQAAINMGAAITSNDPSIPFDKAYNVSKKMVEQIQLMDRAFVGTADELTMLADAMVTYGMGLDLSTKKAQDQMVAFGNLIKVMTRGQSFNIQAFQEIRSLMDGSIMRGAMLVQKLEAAGVNVKQMVPVWREQGTLLENIIKILPGYLAAGKEIEKTWDAQRSTLTTIHNKILREGFTTAYADIMVSLKGVNDALLGVNGLTETGKELADKLAYAWDAVYVNAKNLWAILKDIGGILDAIFGRRPEDESWVAMAVRGWSYILAIIRVVADEMRNIVTLGAAAASAAYNAAKAAYEASVGDFAGAKKSWEASKAAWAEAGRVSGEAYKKSLDEKLVESIAQVDERLKKPPKPPKAWADILREDYEATEKMFAPGAKGNKEKEEARKKALEGLQKTQREIEKMQFDAAARRLEDEDKLAADIARIWESMGNKYADLSSRQTEQMLAAGKTKAEAIKADQELLRTVLEEGQALEADAREKHGKKVFSLQQQAEDAIFRLREAMAKRDWQSVNDRLENEKRLYDAYFKWRQEAAARALDIQEAENELSRPESDPWNYEAMRQYDLRQEALKWDVKIRVARKGLESLRKYEESFVGPRMEGETELYEAQQAELEAHLARMEELRTSSLAKYEDETSKTTQRVNKIYAEHMEALRSTFDSVFYDALSGKFRSLEDYFNNFMDRIRQSWSQALSDMIVEWINAQAQMEVKSALKGLFMKLGGLFGGGSEGFTGTEQQSYTAMDSQHGGMYGLKEGGIFPGRFIPVRAFASGGIADRPTFGLIGEGGGPEAVIPLKGGAVPVKLNRRAGDERTTNINFNVVTQDAKDFGKMLYERRGYITGIVRQEILNAGMIRDAVKRYA